MISGGSLRRVWPNVPAPASYDRRDYVTVENEAWSNRQLIGDIPLTVITNDFGDVYENEEQRTNVEGQKGWLKLSPRAHQVVVTSGHDVPENEPDLVVNEVRHHLRGEVNACIATATTTSCVARRVCAE